MLDKKINLCKKINYNKINNKNSSLKINYQKSKQFNNKNNSYNQRNKINKI